MKWNTFSGSWTVAFVAAVFLLSPALVAAGDRYHGNPFQPPTHTASAYQAPAQPAFAPSARPSQVVISIGPPAPVRAPRQPAKEPLYVTLRGPDGQMRRFLVEGGRAAIQAPQVVLHPGESVTIRWVAGK
jgi:hypothetical protein